MIQQIFRPSFQWIPIPGWYSELVVWYGDCVTLCGKQTLVEFTVCGILWCRRGGAVEELACTPAHLPADSIVKGELNLYNKWQSDDLFHIVMNENHARGNRFW